MKFNFFLSLLILPALLISCTKTGALTGGSAGANNGSFSGNLTGSVSGGLSPVSGATVTLFSLPIGSSAPTSLASATTNSAGGFTLNYTNPGGNAILYVLAVNGSAGSGSSSNTNIQMAAMLGQTSNVPASLLVNELSTSVFINTMTQFGLSSDTNGAISYSLPSRVSTASFANIASQTSTFITNGAINSGVSTANQTILFSMANSIASCIENSNKCGTLFNTAQSGSNTAAANIMESLFNMINVSSDSTAIYTLAFPLGATTGYNMTGSTPSTLTVVPNAAATNTFTVGSSPAGLAIDASGNLWEANNGNGNVKQLSPSGTVLGTFTVGSNPAGVAIDAGGDVWVTNNGTTTITELTSSGSPVGTFSAGAGSNPRGLTIDSFGNVWVCNNGSDSVAELNSSGTIIGTFTITGGATHPNGIAIDGTGNVWVASDTGGTVATVTKLSSSGVNLGVFTFGSQARSVTVDPSGNVFVTDSVANIVTKLNNNGISLGSISLSGHGDAIAIDGANNVWVANQAGNITKLTSSLKNLGSYTAGSSPAGLAIDPSGNVWASNNGGSTITQVTGVALGPQFYPYSGPIYAGGGGGI